MKQYAPLAGWVAFLAIFAALLAYYISPDKPFIALALGGIGLLSAVFTLVVDRETILKAARGRTALYGFNTTLMVLVVLGILIFINMIAFRHKHRIDMTKGGLYSLAPQTEKIVSNLAREVKLTAFFQTEHPDKRAFKTLVDGYMELTDKIQLSFVDPDKSPAITKQYGITTYGTLVLESGTQETKIAVANEENLTNGILKVINDEKKTIYFLDGHGEKNIEGLGKESYSSIKDALEKDNFIVHKLLLVQSGKIPDDASVLVIAGPTKPLLEKELEIIEKFLNAGGSVLALLDPQTDPGMSKLLEAWGIFLQDDMVIDPLSRLFGGDNAMPIVNQYTFHSITRDFVLPTIFPLVRSVRIQPVSDVATVELLKTGDNSWGETELADQVKYDEGKDLKGPVPVVVVASKILNKTETPEKELEKQEPEAETDPGDDHTHSESPSDKEKAHMVVIGDSDFASNNFISFSGNSDFFLNITSWLAKEENLISIRPKERTSAPLQLTQTTGRLISIFGIIVFPGAVALMGFRTWWRKRSL